MKVVIFAGGAGKRFWPASRINNPKQFQKVHKNKPLIRNAFDELLQGFDKNDIYFSTGKKYEKEVKAIFPDVPIGNFIFEPEMRDNGPAVILAVSFLNHKFPNETIFARWSDQIVKDEKKFIKCLKLADSYAQEGKMVFLAVPPRFASPNLGYIKLGKEIKRTKNSQIRVHEFTKFIEKPSIKVAKEYIASGEYGWNLGYWVFKPELFLNKIRKSQPEMFNVCRKIVESNFDPKELKKYKTLEKIPIDYIFAEKVLPNEAVVVLAEIGWSDVGEWSALKEALEKDSNDVVTKGNVYAFQSKDSIIYNFEKDKLIAAVCLDKFVVVNTPDVIAIFPKKENAKLKEFLKEFENTKYSKYL